MRKEIVLAIFAGLSLGLVVAFGLWRASAALKSQSPQSKTPTPISSPNAFLGLTIAKPETDSVISQNPVTITGITKAASWVVVSGESEDQIVQAGASGEFSGDLDLDAAANQIKIVAFDGNGASQETSLLLVYSTEFAKVLDSAPTPKPTSGESDIRDKVQKKVEEVLKNPKAYIGTVTGVNENTLQIKTATGEIKQAAVDPEHITVIQTGKTSKEVKFGDIAIGDFIITMGYLSSAGMNNGNGVLDAQRILVTSPLTEPTRKIFMGKVAAIGKKDVDIKIFGKDDIVKFTPAANSKIKISDLALDKTIIIVGSQEKDTFQVRTIKVI